ncbi:MAG TPA: single-stranded DNA-binding protein [Opitutaceae bacterium]|nr:single-stranded DNA-binding protein [Opitutaceae bacterium]
MAYLNKVFLIGNLTRDPELRVTPKGTAICQFGLAVNRQYKDESGATRDETAFIDIEAWGKQGELCSKYLQKGSPAFIEGRLRFDSWEDKQSGQKRNKLKVVLDNVQFLPRGGGGTGGGAGGASAGGEAPAATGGDDSPAERNVPPPRGPAKPAAGGPAHVEDDVPF